MTVKRGDIFTLDEELPKRVRSRLVSGCTRWAALSSSKESWDMALTSLPWPLLPWGGSFQGVTMVWQRGAHWRALPGNSAGRRRRTCTRQAHGDTSCMWSSCPLYTKPELQGWWCKKRHFSKAHPFSKGTMSPRGGKPWAFSSHSPITVPFLLCLIQRPGFEEQAAAAVSE